MIKRAANILMCIFLLLLAGGCDQNPVAPETDDAALDLLQKDWLQDYLSDLWAASDHGDWDVISGWINPMTGGVISGVPASWPAGNVFSVRIPRRALPIEVYEPFDDEPVNNKSQKQVIFEGGDQRLPYNPIIQPVLISIYVPRYYPAEPGNFDYPAVIRLEPHGLEFSKPVTVTFCYPPWLATSPDYYKFHFWREGVDPDWTYYYSDLELLTPPGPDPRTDLVFDTLHFSRWGMENGSGGGSGKSMPLDRQ